MERGPVKKNDPLIRNPKSGWRQGLVGYRGTHKRFYILLGGWVRRRSVPNSLRPPSTYTDFQLGYFIMIAVERLIVVMVINFIPII